MSNTFRILNATLPAATYLVWRRAKRWLALRLDLTGATTPSGCTPSGVCAGASSTRNLRRADVAVVSFGKSGRTWLRVMMSRLYQQVYGLPEDTHDRVRQFPQHGFPGARVFFTHDNYIGDYTGNTDSKADFEGKKVLLMVRDPRDVAVSQFFQWKFRMRPEKKALNDYPEHGADCSIHDFVMHEGGGMPKVIAFMNLWARERTACAGWRWCATRTCAPTRRTALARVPAFLDIPADAARIRRRWPMRLLREHEEEGGRQQLPHERRAHGPRRPGNPDSYKTRRAKVGGYRDYFEDDQIEAIDALLAARLDPVYGYGTDRDTDSARA